MGMVTWPRVVTAVPSTKLIVSSHATDQILMALICPAVATLTIEISDPMSNRAAILRNPSDL